jgi:hypothetical protein
LIAYIFTKPLDSEKHKKFTRVIINIKPCFDLGGAIMTIYHINIFSQVLLFITIISIKLYSQGGVEINGQKDATYQQDR